MKKNLPLSLLPIKENLERLQKNKETEFNFKFIVKAQTHILELVDFRRV